MKFDESKLAELILFFSQDKALDVSELNRLLFTADFLAYGHLGHSITGTRYVHGVKGPMPDPSQYSPEALEEHSVPNLSLFTDKELAVCRDALQQCAFPDDFLGWQCTEEGETIPYCTVFFWHDNLVTQDDITWAIGRARH